MEYRTNIDKFILIGAGKTTDYLNAYMKKLGKTFKDAFYSVWIIIAPFGKQNWMEL